jgi:hypothetical protein
MRSSGLDIATTAKAARVHPTTLSSYRSGSVLPFPVTVARLADALDAPHLVTVAAKARTRDCARCGKTFVSVHHVMRFCSERCRRFHNYGVEKSRRPAPADRLRSQARLIPWLESEVKRVEGERDAVLAAVAAYCWACEPEGLCRDATSLLREWSPLPLADERLRVA